MSSSLLSSSSLSLGEQQNVLPQVPTDARTTMPTSTTTTTSTSTSLDATRRNRGLEIARDTATPQPGGMVLYIKAGPDGVSVGDCPFAHYVRIVLEEKNLDYELKPSTYETKPLWLLDHYDGKMPALRHRKECYTESDTIVKYLDFFFPTTTDDEQQQQQQSSQNNKELITLAEEAIDGLFPAIAKYVKYSGNDESVDDELYTNLMSKLQQIDDHLTNNVLPTLPIIEKNNDDSIDQPFYLTGLNFNVILDAKILPYFYTMQIACNEYKTRKSIQIPLTLQKYINYGMARQSFQVTKYDPSVAIWGWGNARK